MNRWRYVLVCAGCLAAGVGPMAARGQVTEPARVLDAGGGRSAGNTFISVSAFGQPAPVGVCTGSASVSAGGFLQAMIVDPAADWDADGIADEDDLDDDADGLADARELTGETFDPATRSDPLRADTDQDGAGDGAEAAAGTNPLDPGSRLAVTGIRPVPADGVQIEWLAREGRRYEVLRASSATHGVTNGVPVATLAPSGGTGTWHVTTASVTNRDAGDGGFYRVRLARP